MRHVILISGKDSLATAIVQTRRRPDLVYEYVHNEVGWDLPETLQWIKNVEAVMGWKIIRCGDDLTEICFEQNCLPLAGIRRFCTKYAKIKPLNDYLGTGEVTIYFGLRADEPDRVGYAPAKNQKCVYPLREEAIDINGVMRLCSEVNLMPPAFYWPWMEHRVRTIIQDREFLIEHLTENERRSLFAWRTRSNCDRCPYQRQYEWIGLSEFHPERFAMAVELEQKLCHRDEHTWVRGYRLPELKSLADEIKEKRAKAIAAWLENKSQGMLFDDDMIDELNVTSCGLLCGK